MGEFLNLRPIFAAPHRGFERLYVGQDQDRIMKADAVADDVLLLLGEDPRQCLWTTGDESSGCSLRRRIHLEIEACAADAVVATPAASHGLEKMARHRNLRFPRRMRDAPAAR